jgi:hypothetical protein
MKAILVALLLFGCGSNGTNPMGGDDEPPAPDAPPIPEGFTRLIGRTWSLPGGATDTYRCVRFTVQEDMYITSIQAQAPFGTHHTVLSFAGGNGTAGPDGEQNCGVGTIGRVMMYASGVGTSPLDFPTDVGLHIPAGTQIHLNLHLFNATDEPIEGDTAILVKAQTTPPPMLAEMVFAGKILFSIPSNDQDFTTIGGCTVSTGFTTFAVWPHQHQLGTHQKISVIRGTGQSAVTTVLHDGAYSFSEQNYYLQDPMFEVQAGDKIEVACTWRNNTGRSVGFGESSEEEMCFGGFYRFPALNEGIAKCTDTGGLGF